MGMNGNNYKSFGREKVTGLRVLNPHENPSSWWCKGSALPVWLQEVYRVLGSVGAEYGETSFVVLYHLL